MAESWTLLADLIPRLTNRIEDSAVEALGFILKESQASLAALNSLVRTGGVIMPEIVRVRTQVSGDEGTRPDLVGFDAEGKERLLIEAKFWAGLTDNQPNAYLARLPDDSPAALLFVAPEARIPALWPELEHRVGKKLESADSGDGIHSAIVDSAAKRLLIVSWARLLSRMSERVKEVHEDPGVQAGIQQLLGLTRRMDDDQPLPLHQEEFAPHFARRVRDYMRLVDESTERCAGEQWLSTERCAGEQWLSSGHHGSERAWYGYCRDLTFAGTAARFGIRWTLWLENGTTPLWLQIHSESVFNQMRDKLPASPGDRWIPIYLKTGVEYSVVLEDVVRQLKAICDAVTAAKADA